MKISTPVFCGISCSLIIWASVGPGCCLILGRALSTSGSSLSLSGSCRKEGAMYHRSQRVGMKRDSSFPLLKNKYLWFGYLKQKIPLPRCERFRVPNIFARDLSTPRTRELRHRGQRLRYEAGFWAQEEQAEQKEIGTGTDVSAGHRHFHVPRHHVRLRANLQPRVRMPGSQRTFDHFPFLYTTAKPPFFSSGSSFILTSITMPNIPCKKSLWWNSLPRDWNAEMAGTK